MATSLLNANVSSQCSTKLSIKGFRHGFMECGIAFRRYLQSNSLRVLPYKGYGSFQALSNHGNDSRRTPVLSCFQGNATKYFDFIVIGSGIAGLRFALEVSKHGSVAIITKAEPHECNTNYAQGAYLCDEETVRPAEHLLSSQQPATHLPIPRSSHAQVPATHLQYPAKHCLW